MADELPEILVPVAGLTVQASAKVGPVRLLTPEDAHTLAARKPRVELSHLEEEFEEGLKQGGAAVRAETVEGALALISSALAVVRVFQQTLSVAETPDFGLPGEVWTAKIPLLYIGESSAGTLWARRGHHLGSGFNDAQREALAASTGFQLAASAIGHPSPSEGQHRALLAVELTSRAHLQSRPDLRLLHAVMALEVMFRDGRRAAQTYLLARRVAYLTCGEPQGSLCGRDRPTCPLLKINPRTDMGRADLERFAPGCTQYAQVLDWYDDRSAIAHQGVAALPGREDRKVLFWLTHRLLPQALGWLAQHPDEPIQDLEEEIKALPEPFKDSDDNFLMDLD